ncbi:VOC family protein [Bacillus ndiopicus]|uniref:VOC family protein n=1 Tax=Bacillus ndiopicus TaxID=1347368 RepID=UPI0005A8BD9D|nr:VOC family protein [Bacillus ndiopicus]
MQKIIPFLWYAKQAEEAASFYKSLFEDSSIIDVQTMKDTPSGDAELVTFKLAGQQFQSIGTGAPFTLNPSISFMVACETAEEVNAKWEALSEGGIALMPLAEYPFSKWFGWIQDRYGLSWQLSLTEQGVTKQKITPHFLFSNVACGKAEEAIRYYTEVFSDSKINLLKKFEENEEKVNMAAFTLEGINFSAMDNSYDVPFHFNEAFSFMINCEDQAEIDYFIEKLSYIPQAEQCGWVKDQFGVSWQVVPHNLSELLGGGTTEENKRVGAALQKMKRINIAELKKARQE